MITKDYRRIIPVLVTAFIIAVEMGISFNSVLLPNLKGDFQISSHLAQMTIASGLFALGFSGIIYGGLADSLGRRPILVFSICLFSLTSLICALAPTVEVFLISKFFQGLGSGAGWVVGNACLKDIFHGDDYTKVMNYTHAIAGITPAVAPIVGSNIAVYSSWRTCFLFLFAVSLLAALAIYCFQIETLKKKKTISCKRIVQDYGSLFRSRKFISYLVVKVLCVMLLFCEVSNLPLILVETYNINPKNYSHYVFPLFIVYVFASILSARLCRLVSVKSVLVIGTTAILLSNLTLILFVLQNLEPISPSKILILKSLTYLGWGFIFGNATAMVVSAVPTKTGMASACMIALEMIFSSIGIYILGLNYTGTFLPLSIYMVITSLVVLVSLALIKK